MSQHAIRLCWKAKAYRPYLITECGNKSDVGLLLTLKKDKTMLDINELYLLDKQLNCDSIFSEEQDKKLSLIIQPSIDLLIELCVNAPTKLKQIIYLAEDLLWVAKSVPSYLNNKVVVDMRVQVCQEIHELAALASKIEIGMPVNIDNQLKVIQGYHS